MDAGIIPLRSSRANNFLPPVARENGELPETVASGAVATVGLSSDNCCAASVPLGGGVPAGGQTCRVHSGGRRDRSVGRKTNRRPDRCSVRTFGSNVWIDARFRLQINVRTNLADRPRRMLRSAGTRLLSARCEPVWTWGGSEVDSGRRISGEPGFDAALHSHGRGATPDSTLSSECGATPSCAVDRFPVRVPVGGQRVPIDPAVPGKPLAVRFGPPDLPT